MGNPFQGTAPAEPEVTETEIENDETADVELEEPDLDVDADASADTAEDAPEDTADTPPARAGNVRKVGEAKPKSSKNPVAEGYIAPVAAARKLSEHLTALARAAGRIADDEEIVIAPQVVYATLKNNGEGSRNPIPQYTDPAITGGLKSVVKLSEFLQWWVEKDERVAARKSNVKKTKPADAAPAETVHSEAPAEAE